MLSSNFLLYEFQIADEAVKFVMPPILIRHSKECRRMNGRHYGIRSVERKELPAITREESVLSQDGENSRGAHWDNHLGLNSSNLRFKPRIACAHLGTARFFMEAAFAPFFESKMLHRVGDVNYVAVYARFQ